MLRRVLLLSAVLAVGLLTGCQTAPDIYPGDTTAPGDETLTAEDGRFILRATSILGADINRSGGEFFISFTTWPLGRNAIAGLVPIAQQNLERMHRGYLLVEDAGQRGVLQMDASRFFSSVALNAQGWIRIGWGVWRHPHLPLSVRFLPDRYWLIATTKDIGDGLKASPGAVPRQAAGSRFFSDEFMNTAGMAQRPVGMAGWMNAPVLEGVPDFLQPENVRFSISAVNGAAVTIAFSEEPLARIALVPLRLQAEEILRSYGFVPRSDFDIIRSGRDVHITGFTVRSFAIPEAPAETSR